MQVRSTPKANYDRRSDVLYITVGDTSESYGTEDNHGIIILRDTFTDEITGITILGFKANHRACYIRQLLLDEEIEVTDILKKYLK